MRDRPRRRKPTTPGEILREEFLIPLGMTQRLLADHLGCDVKVVNRIVNGRSSVTAEMALKLAASFRTTPEFWLNAQKAVDLHRAASRVPSLPRPLLRAG
jgi:addiction module HigA family antidote